VVSKRFKQYLREYKPLEHWLLSKYPKTVDTYQSLTKNVVGNPTGILKNLGSSGQDRNLYDKTLNIEKRALAQHETYLQSVDFSDLAVFDILSRNLPRGIILHLANSTPVRYTQLFPTRPGVHYHSNRGVSGIDGPLSTAAGLAFDGQKEVFLITGDLAFIYDSNGMWNKQLFGNLKIIVINNREGNIFRLIKTGPAIHGAMDYFTTPHEVDIASLVKAFGLCFFSAGSRESLFEVLPEFLKPKDKPCVLEIQTSAEKSAEAFKNYFEHLK
jgi:2-succinyl-5-enolpyruvyl-6-hydroxy-3-cyclohexene-1-carboxylate synthase